MVITWIVRIKLIQGGVERLEDQGDRKGGIFYTLFKSRQRTASVEDIKKKDAKDTAN